MNRLHTRENNNSEFVIGVDVGTGSARAGVFDLKGNLLSSASHPIQMWKEQGERFEQSSADIWSAVCHAVRQTIELANIKPSRVAGIGFDATCSLVLIAADGKGVAVGDTKNAERDVMVWMDQRATEEAKFINRLQHDVLKYVGGKISPEMQIPKLLWLQKNLPESFEKTAHFFDLSDFLTWRATDDVTRSTCTLTCKWTYLAHENRFDKSFFKEIGLEVLSNENFKRIGTNIVAPGTPIANGLSAKAASELGLVPGTAVAAALIDAHAGGVGSLTNDPNELAYIFGTSACIMASSQEPKFVSGVWGPYYNSMLQNVWLLEGGQSSAGSAIDHILRMHPAYIEALELAQVSGKSVISWIETQIETSKKSSDQLTQEVADLHIVPDFLGNRSPNADPTASAIISGLRLEDSLASLQQFYIAAILAVAYGARQTFDVMNTSGLEIKSLVMSGGAGKSNLVQQLIADATGLNVSHPTCEEPVLLGSAILAAMASNRFQTMADAANNMNKRGRIFRPSADIQFSLHNHKYRAFKLLQEVNRTIGKF